MQITIWGEELNCWVTGAILAEQGNQIVFPQSLPPENLSEPGLKTLLDEQIASKRIELGKKNALRSEIHIMSFSANQKDTALEKASLISNSCDFPIVLINQSNFGIGATVQIAEKMNPERDHQVAYIPDNILAGRAIEHLKNLSSLTIGSDNPETILKIRALMHPLLIDPQKVVTMSHQEAEFSKFAVTGMLALRIGYINELANLADDLNVDIEPIRHAMTLDPRISPEYLKPGCGFGGLNFSQYITGLADILQEERRSTLLHSVLQQNEQQKETPFRKIWRHFNGNLEGKTISIWGLSFKPNTASIDNAPSLRVIDALLSQGAKIQAHDPAAMDNALKLYGSEQNFTAYTNNYDALEHSDALILLTEWREYSAPDFAKMKELMKGLVIIDGRNLLDKNQAQEFGFHYEGIGR